MSLILNIETASKNCSVSLAKEGKTILCKEMSEEGYSHAEKLHVFIEEILKETNTNFQELKAVAISKGPGSYTGLRIGVSAAKGICYALNIPLISVDTLQVLAKQAKIDEGIIIPMLDARRMEVYSAVFDKNYNKIMDVQAEVVTAESYMEIEEDAYFVGDCQEKCKTVLTKPNFHFVSNIIFPSANEMSALSHQKFVNQEWEDVAYFEPFYLKDFMITKKS
ncbi:MAG TPA: tRNA (adenosine(37)-N6)-threonylcarbamoyltransferase complex dimerization subunit type 1 TsaB [Flavobacterium sp.]|jgi:tRNA threonylcarbamoyladenosine biosynthesis protein TsaB|uniref:tRNA (adenosine(37)-N6)-threonylcarbamoyltransferase complex dimerization subunit type 1 TsaB n=1 Tax=Flavobacterium sp. TaxID=239 RepID=UPI002D0EEC2F|nr:tRNA (adenosine(37)-N6)-threonylcarbamoyltransferase complex dimerization subunit type 1 TsaB [Flavobacterium sp.]HPW97793.1 tRNA (adenosine(37)-N6)-threonylcarbamoyltransferase complex dimerization subunit type 1 TsaB [Flavobacterium sp.]HQA73935.1 tRNA (adenosine(37)-N6)-threonylcarbamoyltransferase complex dimerization subunit type 1 TsaB [Flavobacterium sp.]